MDHVDEDNVRTLTVFEDDGSNIASVTVAGKLIFTHARSSREWSMVARWIRQGFYVLDEGGQDYIEIKPGDPRFLDMLASRAHEYDFSTELSGDDE